MLLESNNQNQPPPKLLVQVDEFGEIIEPESLQPGPQISNPDSRQNIAGPQPVQAEIIPARPLKKAASSRPRRLPAPKEQVIIWWGAVLFGLVLFGLGGFLWAYGSVKQAEQVALPEVDVKTLTIREPVLPTNQQISFNLSYALAVNAFNNGQPAEATSQLKSIVEVAPNFKKDAAAFLFIAYRASALDKMGDSKAEAEAITYFDEALNLRDQYPDTLLVQFKLKPDLLPPGLPDLPALVDDLGKEKRWFELYRQGESFQDKKVVNWFDDASTRWRSIYDENRTFLKDKGSRWVALRLLEAYQAQSTYNCTTKKDYNKARRSLIDARGITIDNGLEQQRAAIDKKLTDIAAKGCN